jgi:hypothetical protein
MCIYVYIYEHICTYIREPAYIHIYMYAKNKQLADASCLICRALHLDAKYGLGMYIL